MTLEYCFINTKGQDYRCESVRDLLPIQKFHYSLPDFETTPLLAIHGREHGIISGKFFLKDESNRAGLPSFKILGASWGAFRAITDRLGLSIDSSLSEVKENAQVRQLTLCAATDGNHGRAIARMAKILGVPAIIFVPVNFVTDATVRAIESEGAVIYRSELDYDAMIMEAYDYVQQDRKSTMVYIQDTSFPGYTKIPTFIVDGYSTMLAEIEQQLHAQNLTATHIITPVGVGSLAHAVVTHCKSAGRCIQVITVEPEMAACLNHALASDAPTPIKTGKTIMEGMNCGTVSDISWPFLRNGVDASLTVSEIECHEAVHQLSAQGVETGPCGAASFAGMQKLLAKRPNYPGIDHNSVIVMLATEGSRMYQIPQL
jgi:diaminopropionate ammonia-lyase